MHSWTINVVLYVTVLYKSIGVQLYKYMQRAFLVVLRRTGTLQEQSTLCKANFTVSRLETQEKKNALIP